MIRAHVLICGGTGGTSSGSQSNQEAFAANIEAKGLPEEVQPVPPQISTCERTINYTSYLFSSVKVYSATTLPPLICSSTIRLALSGSTLT